MTRVDDNNSLMMEQMLAKLRSLEFAQASGLSPEDIVKGTSSLSAALHSVPHAQPIFKAPVQSEAEATVKQFYVEANDKLFNLTTYTSADTERLDAEWLEWLWLALDTTLEWNENYNPKEGWAPSNAGPSVSGPAPPTPYDAHAALPQPLGAAPAAPIMSQSLQAPSPNV